MSSLEFADYLLDNYGVCTRGADSDCECLKKTWRGRGCLYWKPLGATTLDQLKEAQETVRAALGGKDSNGLPRSSPRS